MQFFCPHCGQSFEVNVGKMIGHRKSEKKALASRLNGALGGQPKKDKPVRLRRHHPAHPEHHEYLKEKAEQEAARRSLGLIQHPVETTP